MINVHCASLTSQGVQHSVCYLDGHPSRYQPRPTGLYFGEQMGTGDSRTSHYIGSVNNLRGAFSPNEGVITSEKERKGKEKTKVNRTHFFAKNMSI